MFRRVFLLLSILLFVPFSLSLPRKSRIAKRHVDYVYDTGSDADEYTDTSYDDMSLLPGEVDALRNIMMELMDILDDGDDKTADQSQSQENRRSVNGEGEPVVIIVVEKEDQDPNDITLASLLYDDEEPWSRCTRSCTSRRYRECLYEDLCGTDPMVEEAFCYAPGSKCESKVNDYLKKEGYTIVDYNEDEVENDDPVKDPDYIPEYTEDEDDESVLYPDAADNTVGDYYDYGWSDYLAGKTDDDYPTYETEEAEEAEEEEVIEEEEEGDLYDYAYDQDQDEYVEEEEEEEEQEEDVVFEGCGKRRVRTTEGLMRILGGREAHKGSWPWQVAVLNRFKETFCGGTLIAPQWVLTAAHCIRKRLYVRVGEHDLRAKDKNEIEMRVEQSFGHPDYDVETIEHDIALLKLPREVDYNRYVIPACLPGIHTPPPMRSKCVITGWGKEKETFIFGSDVLLYARVPIVTKSACRAAYPDHPITMNHFCAGFTKGTSDACAGDSGGPLVCDDKGAWTVHGVTSFGEGCGDTGKFGVYTKVKNYLKWMKTIINENK